MTTIGSTGGGDVLPGTDKKRPDYSHLFRLDGRRAVVVGGGSGIGKEACLALAAQGAEVFAADRDEAGAADTASLAEGLDGSVTAYALDVLDEQSVMRAATELDPVDVLVFTAGTNVRKRVLDYSAAEFEKVVALNLRAAFDLVRAFGPGMAERGRGSIIGMSSMRSVMVEPGQGVYAATKAGLLQLLRTVAAELGPQGVRANTIAPAGVATPLTNQIRADEQWGQAYATKTALQRWATPDEMTGAIVFLASDASSYVTGTQVAVDAGWTSIDGRYDPPMG